MGVSPCSCALFTWARKVWLRSSSSSSSSSTGDFSPLIRILTKAAESPGKTQTRDTSWDFPQQQTSRKTAAHFLTKALFSEISLWFTYHLRRSWWEEPLQHLKSEEEHSQTRTESSTVIKLRRHKLFPQPSSLFHIHNLNCLNWLSLTKLFAFWQTRVITCRLTSGEKKTFLNKKSSLRKYTAPTVKQFIKYKPLQGENCHIPRMISKLLLIGMESWATGRDTTASGVANTHNLKQFKKKKKKKIKTLFNSEF